jgi:hypothetical protein
MPPEPIKTKPAAFGRYFARSALCPQLPLSRMLADVQSGHSKSARSEQRFVIADCNVATRGGKSARSNIQLME